MKSQSYKFKRRIVLHYLFVIIACFGCSKLVEVNPPVTSTTSEDVYTLNETAISALTGIYSRLSSGSSSFVTGSFGISLLSGLSSDELVLYGGVPNADNKSYYYKNQLYSSTPTSNPGTENWGPFYAHIFTCNSIIEGVSNSSSLTQSVKQQLLGEAMFLRAFFYFYLTNLYGDVPLILTTDYKVNSKLPNSPSELIYRQIITDLKNSRDALSDDFVDGTLVNKTQERVRPNKWVAASMLARVYLYTEDYVNAEKTATLVINNSLLFQLLPLNDVFLKNSKEAIWQLQPTTVNYNTFDARMFVIPATGPNNNNNGNPVYLSKFLLSSFEQGDLRSVYDNWIDTITVSGITYHYPYKYKANFQKSNINATTGTNNMTEYLMIFRLAELYLIRAEARLQNGDITGAESDLNVIRNRAGLLSVKFNDKNLALKTILHERKVELFTELGHRWLDLKRTRSIDSVMSSVTPIKSGGSAWISYQQLYPIPMSEIQSNPNLYQSPGY